MDKIKCTFNWAIFPMIAGLLDGKIMNVSVCIPIPTLTPWDIAEFFRATVVTVNSVALVPQ